MHRLDRMRSGVPEEIGSRLAAVRAAPVLPRAARRPVPTVPVPPEKTFVSHWGADAMAERAEAQPFISKQRDIRAGPSAFWTDAWRRPWRCAASIAGR